MTRASHITRRTAGVALLAGAAFAAGLIAVPDARAQSDYPNQPITMIVPFAPGGASDFAARLLQPKLSEILGQQVVVENRDGAAGNVGMDLAARAKPSSCRSMSRPSANCCARPPAAA